MTGNDKDIPKAHGKMSPNLKITLCCVLSCLIMGATVLFLCTKWFSGRSGNTTITIGENSTSQNSTAEGSTAAAPPKGSEPVTSAEAKPLHININTAGKDELMLLDGIGPAVADRIIEYRSRSPFRSIEELMNVSGVGEKLFGSIRGFIYVDDLGVTTEGTEAVTVPAETEHVLTLEECAPININTAGTELLVLLPHVDEQTAAAVIDLRQRIGGFTHPYEILLVDGMTKPHAAEILPYICVSDEPTA